MARIVSWNVNGIRAVEKKDFIGWLLSTKADAVCIQETKAKQTQLSENLLSPAGYRSYWMEAQRSGYSGTALYTKKEPDKISNMGIERFDCEGRTLAAFFGKTVIISAYFPNSQDAGARLAYKLDYCKAMFDMCEKLTAGGYNIVLCGDYNIAHKPIDLAHPKANEKNPGYLPEERAWMDMFTSNGYIDTFRRFCIEANQYTWWSYRFRAREKNIGWRIDYQCVNERFAPPLLSSRILNTVTGSDHCPIELVFKGDL